MKRYILKRILLVIPVLIGITIITFAIIHLTPGGFTKVTMQMDAKASPDSIQRLKELYGLDQPGYIQYFNWLKRFVRLDFGRSFIDNRPVLEKIGERLPATLLLNVCALITIYVIALVIGVIAALRRNKPFDKVTTAVTFAGYAIPDF